MENLEWWPTQYVKKEIKMKHAWVLQSNYVHFKVSLTFALKDKKEG